MNGQVIIDKNTGTNFKPSDPVARKGFNMTICRFMISQLKILNSILKELKNFET